MSLTLKPRVQVRAKISSVGTYVPPRLLTNADLEKMVETTDQWIVERTGIRERHLVDKGVATSDLAVEAAKKCLEKRGVSPTEVEAIIVPAQRLRDVLVQEAELGERIMRALILRRVGLLQSSQAGPILIGPSRPAHILTPSVTARGILNMTAVAVVEAQERASRQQPTLFG